MKPKGKEVKHMAASKIVNETSLSIEVQTSVDKAGDPIYGKKTFSNVRNDVDTQNAYDVAEAIKGVLEASTGSTFLNASSKLINA
jgi:hypothetical protein